MLWCKWDFKVFSFIDQAQWDQSQFGVKCKETKGRSSGQTPFTIITKITKTASPKKKQFLTPKTLSNLFWKKKFHFHIKQLFSADTTMVFFCLIKWKHEKQPSKVVLLHMLIIDYLFILFFWIDNCDSELRTKLQMHAILKKAMFLIWKNKKQFMALFRNFYFTYQPTFQVLS